MNEANSKIAGQLQRLRRQRKELINATQKNIEKNHELYQQKMKKVGDLLEMFVRMGQESQRNIVSPVKPIPPPFKNAEGNKSTAEMQGGSMQQLGSKKKSAHSSKRQRGSSRQQIQKVGSK